jgi:hypothetical protein
MIGDFEELGICESYDLVISVETLSALPTDERAKKWIDLMIKRSKKYVVNLDHLTDSSVVLYNGRNYWHMYMDHPSVYTVNEFDIPDYKNEKIYITRVK